MTNELTLENIRSGAFPSDAHAVGFLLGEIEVLRGNLSLAEEGLASYALEEKQLRADISQAYDLRDKAEGRYCTALGEIERLTSVVTNLQNECERLMTELDQRPTAHEPLPVAGWNKCECAGCPGLIPSLGASRDASSDDFPECKNEPRDCPYIYCHSQLKCAKEPATRTSPADLVGALQDVVHTDPGPVRAGKAHRDASGHHCLDCGADLSNHPTAASAHRCSPQRTSEQRHD